MSFKYRFILSFVLLEIFFIVLIVSVNFIAISDSSKTLTKNKIESNLTFMEQLLKVPISIYDLATLDDLIDRTEDLKYINSIILLDASDKILSKKYNFKQESIDNILKVKTNKTVNIDDETFEIRYQKIFEDDILLGSMLIIFDTSDSTKFIKSNQEKTIMIVLLEILISTFLSFIIGKRLTTMLTKLTEVAQDMGSKKNVVVPFLEKKDEIGILSNSLNSMYKQINESFTNLQLLNSIQEKQKKDLIIANKAKDDFLANMSHELKTPLNSINIISSVMMKNKKNTLDEKEIKNLNIINNCGNDLLYLINDVLDISKLEASEIKLDYSTFNLYEIMSNIVDMFEPQVKNKNLEFIFEYNKKVQIVYSDKQRIKQIVKNLLSNSLKFTKHGSIKLSIKDDKKNFYIIVKDDGIGINEGKLNHIFDRFKQADSSTTRKFGGTGLGLAICKELTNLLDGKIKVKSKTNIGTIFKLTLPKNEDKITNYKDIKKEEIVFTNTKSSNETILILNNDPISFMSLVIELKKDYSIEQIDTFIDLKNKISTNRYFSVIIDISKIKQSEVDNILLHTPNNSILICDDASVIDKTNSNITYFTKPIKSSEILTHIHTLKDEI
jgi:signal transduction histidine kinase